MKKILLILLLIYFLSPSYSLASQEVVFDNIEIVTQELQQCNILKDGIKEYENSVTILGDGWNNSESLINNLNEQLIVCEKKNTVTEDFCSIEKEAIVELKKIHSAEVKILETQLKQYKPTFINKVKNASGWFGGGMGVGIILILVL